MENEILIIVFYFVIIFGSNVIQGITGFAGTLLALPFIIMLMDLESAKQIMNITGILTSGWIIYKDCRCIEWTEFKKIILCMIFGVCCGMLFYNLLPTHILLYIFPVFIILVGVRGIGLQLHSKLNKKPMSYLAGSFILFFAGIIHGIFVSGGPLLVAYTTEKISDKKVFRATLSMCWLVLNSIILLQSVAVGNMNLELWKYAGMAVIPLALGVWIGGICHSKMSQKTFMFISYILLVISGVSLLIT